MENAGARAIHRTPMAIPVSMLMLMTVLAALLAGCNTSAGFGKDMQSAGTAIEHKAEKSKAQ